MMSRKIFISYRRDDSAGHAGRVRDRFTAEFGNSLVFMDVDNIEPGANFVEELRNAVSTCEILVAIIGSKWLTARDRVRKRRLDDPDDFVRVEIATALARKIPVVPVLLDGTKMPVAARLPDDLKDLSNRIAIAVNHQSFDTDILRLIASIRKRLAEAPPSNEPGDRHGRVPTAPAPLAHVPPQVRMVARRFAVAALGLAALAFAAVVASRHLSTSLLPAPQWQFQGDTFIGNIPFAWTFDGALLNKPDTTATAGLRFELASADDANFRVGVRSDYADSFHKYLGGINAVRYWRVRAIDLANPPAPLSHWSAARSITQYDSAYDRIRTTRRIMLMTTKSDTQGIFKWVDSRGAQGFDIRLAGIIRDALVARIDAPIEPLRPVPVLKFSDLLEAPRAGLADMVVSTVTKLEQRRRDYHLEFSDTYYCTTYAFVHRAADEGRSIAAMIEGKVVGVLPGRTGHDLAEALRKETPFTIRFFNDNETAIREVAQSRIDYFITDTPYAETEMLKYWSSRNRIAYREFKKPDFPPSFPKSRWLQEYGVVIHKGEDVLLGIVNSIIKSMKGDGSLARLFEQVRLEYVVAHGLPRDALAGPPGRDAPWECRL